MKIIAVLVFVALVLAADSTPQCAKDGESCTLNHQCCSGDCEGWFNGATCKPCYQSGISCVRDSACCSGQCSGNLLSGSRRCQGSGS